MDVSSIEAALDGFSGVVRVDHEGTVFERACGWADRSMRIPNRVETRFAVASGAKSVTAMVVLALVDRGDLALDRTARSLLGDDLPAIDDGVTVEHLLAHRSGIGDYFDEDAAGPIDAYAMPIPVHRLDGPSGHLPILAGHPQRSAPDERFAYNNGGFVVLGILAERATGQTLAELADTLVCGPAGLTRTGFDRTDEPDGVATGYLTADGPRTNALHLPVRGGGDGGLVTTVGDVHRLWEAWADGRVVAASTVAEMRRIRSIDGDRAYGLGVWLDPTTDAVAFEGYDAGISFRSVHRPSTGVTWTVVSNWSDGAWPVARAVAGATA